jgi:hypothetical protein
MARLVGLHTGCPAGDLRADGPQDTPLRDGELIDIAGFASAEGSAPVLTDAVFKSAGDPASAAPVPPCR